MLKAISIVGFKKSGKTGLVLELIRSLRARGLRVGAAKFSHHELDAPDTDTARMTQAGASTVGLGGSGAAVFWPERRFLPDLIPLLGADVLIVEGGKSLGWLPRVLCLRDPVEAADLTPDLALAVWGKVPAPSGFGLPVLTDVEALADLVLDRGFALPGLDCSACGRESCAALAGEIVAGRAGSADCLAGQGGLRITVNGVPLGLGPFVERVAASTIRGLLAELKGYAPGRVDITLDG